MRKTVSGGEENATEIEPIGERHAQALQMSGVSDKNNAKLPLNEGYAIYSDHVGPLHDGN